MFEVVNKESIVDIEGDNFIGVDQVIKFADVVSTQVVDVHILDYRNKVLKNLSFSISIDTPTSSILCFSKTSKITIIDHLSEPVGLGFINSSQSLMSANWHSRDMDRCHWLEDDILILWY